MKKMHHQAIFYNWRLYVRKGTYYAYGRSNGSNTTRHSLGTSDYKEATENLKKLDVHIAAKNEIREAILLQENRTRKDIGIAQGIELYLNHSCNKQKTKGNSPKTPSRYTAILNKFREYVDMYTKIKNWSQVSNEILQEYAGWLRTKISEKECQSIKPRRFNRAYSLKTLENEIGTIKQAAKYLRDSKLLKSKQKLTFNISAPGNSNRYCYTYDEVREILKLTNTPEFMWLHDICLVLSKTGVRISEL